MTDALFRNFIDGRFDEPSATFDSIDPSTGAPWAKMPAATEVDVDRAVEAAHRALRSGPWASMTATARGKLLVKLGDLVAANAGRLAELETRDTGKIIRETRAQIAYVGDYYRYYGGLADKHEGAHVPIDKADLDVTIRREPIGVVAAVVPWNSQLFLSAVKLGPALAAGCTVVLKASEDGPAPLLAFAELVSEAGFPAGAVNILTGFGQECGRRLTSHPLVSRVAFTGGPSTARAIVRNTAENLAFTTLELGGKSPVVVFADADLDSAANAVVAGIFAATGQSCVAGSRLLIERSVRQEFLGRLKQKAEAIRIGDPQDPATEMGPLATLRQRDWIEKVVAESLAAGGTLVTGGKRPDIGAGFYYAPTIIDAGDINLPCVREELFGPVLSVLAFDTEAEALALANDTPFGLASGVFTSNLGKAHRMARDIHAGVVWVNTYRAVSPLVPFGGYGLSGLGREGGLDAIRDYTRSKSVWIKTSDEPIPDPFVMR
ncbi:MULTISPECIES: aldehyde dehydrogenase [unclassified Mesorhizobium]|uniref:aldehyde dehydrogenase n=1 Tax=unclassified Mesorhizobium TaxID=325217 RepID=UPI000F74E35B|nr:MULTISPECIES: aldehyde dehydrogenase [unclassified Mesorhizobium]AZO21627.1 aldehyde dehydrogenase [Mesorhizobium sp. M1E.F.Ca.ET.045.02.1.1]RUW31606.1 aldehyde dehydrogenase family protein [Mesorhizobium sp. M1E.F.Ca.ET.041.01.1.1]RUW84034.1 aldehyde dehydrogenase family protein [Mesorhizobium sp. M1E.F.Ca.ET.063.01.1.1]RWD91156.1 MAG: aldehyde dehydrogenase family protein [Mesorhizobium sp.]RWD95461.1 MAG: aldehyde dehydrogenase family protein [Mesorhizobium sp.]